MTRAEEKKDWDRVSAWVAGQGHVLDASGAVRFTGGLANLNHLVEFDGRPAVFRRPPAGVLAAGANDMAREWRVLSRLPQVYPLAPRGLLFAPAGAVLEVPFQIIEYRPGIAVSDTLPDDADRQAPARLTGSLIAAMTDLHRVDPDAAGLGDLGRPAGFLARQLASWRRRAQAAWPAGVPAALDRLAERLERDGTEVDGGRVSLLHLDLKFDNMLVDPDTMTAQAVIDWDMATRGDPLFDLAVLLAYWVEPGDPVGLHGLGRVPSLVPGFPTRAELAALYFERSGTTPVRLDWHLALARLRLAVLWMQLFRLWQRGDLTGDHYDSFASLAHGLVEWADENYPKGTQ
ncbi:phosphotransferase family protein [Streptomyces sp. NPDC093252]|uniref:phosphotransferase family protein n=1 Tax=Streptomyces sp. NPDC093252 TaxID=3154980 RepID=UPI003423AF57